MVWALNSYKIMPKNSKKIKQNTLRGYDEAWCHLYYLVSNEWLIVQQRKASQTGEVEKQICMVS